MLAVGSAERDDRLDCPQRLRLGDLWQTSCKAARPICDLACGRRRSTQRNRRPSHHPPPTARETMPMRQPINSTSACGPAETA